MFYARQSPSAYPSTSLHLWHGNTGESAYFVGPELLTLPYSCKDLHNARRCLQLQCMPLYREADKYTFFSHGCKKGSEIMGSETSRNILQKMFLDSSIGRLLWGFLLAVEQWSDGVQIVYLAASGLCSKSSPLCSSTESVFLWHSTYTQPVQPSTTAV